MSEAFDLVVRGGTLFDGTGSPGRTADVAVRGGRIVEVGAGLGPAREEIDADGLLVTPGFVDIHTHYDGQVTWESRLTPSSQHGVTTVVTGNCGVGFAPCRPADHDLLIELMAGVEDIPEVVMTAGLEWNWESFPQYLDAVAARPHDVDIAALLPHSALRVYVMGERAARREEATADDIAAMSALVHEALDAGAVGFATSRALQQRSVHGEPIPTVRAAEDELRGILSAMKASGRGVFQLLSDFYEFGDIDREWAMLRRLVEDSGRPMTFTVNQKHSLPDGWRRLVALAEQANRDGLVMRPQVLGRPTGLLLGHEISTNPFFTCPTYASLAHLAFDEKVQQLHRDEVRRAILAEVRPSQAALWRHRFELSDPPNYEPLPSESVESRATAMGVNPAELAYDILLANGGRQLLFHAFQNYASSSLDECYEMLTHPDAVLGLGDGGAHLGLVCDSSWPSTMLSHWTRDRTRGPRLELADAIRAMTSSNAAMVGLHDRGRVAPGYKADLNVIDYDRVQERQPSVTYDLPGGGRRLVQRADGYVATIVSGQIIARNGEATGVLPGVLVRGAQPQPA